MPVSQVYFRKTGLCLLVAFLSACHAPQAGLDYTNAGSDWAVYGGDAGARQYSTLRKITPLNVNSLEQAWVYHSAAGYELPPNSELQVNPLVVDGVVFGISPQYRVFALDGKTGKRLWEFDPEVHVAKIASQGEAAKFAMMLSHKRGFAYWTDGVSARLFFSVAHYLLALDARTGSLVGEFGSNGVVDLREGLDRPVELLGVSGNTPGIIYRNLLIMGTRVGEHKEAAPGDIRAYDVFTGRIVWTFRTIPRDGEPGSETWPDQAWRHFGGANAWAGMSVDHHRGLLFAPLGSPSNDFLGIERHGSNLYGNSLVALDAGSGELKWYYQFVHHDLWDRDPNATPTLVTVQRDNKTIDAVAQTTKQGFVFVFDRDTGESLFPIAEVAVPASSVPGERAWPSQPRPLAPPPFARETFGESDLARLDDLSHKALTRIYQELLPPDYFAPLGPRPRILMPGYDGGATWGGAAFSPKHQLLVVNSQDRPAIGQVGPVQGGNHPGNRAYQYFCSQCHLPDRQGVENAVPPLLHLDKQFTAEQLGAIIQNGRGRMPAMPLPSYIMNSMVEFLLLDDETEKEAAPITSGSQDYVFSGYRYFVDPEGYPAIEPPWGSLTAIDLNEGTFAWQVVLGEHEELTRRGIAQTGTLNYGGPVITASGLVFIAATMDSKLRAFELETGKLLWQSDLPAPAFSTPAVYAVDGEQFIVVACGGGKLGTSPGDSYVAFRLPN